MPRIHVTRTLNYVGDSDWIAKVLEKSALQLGQTLDAGQGIIYLTEETRHACQDDEDDGEELPVPETPYEIEKAN